MTPEIRPAWRHTLALLGLLLAGAVGVGVLLGYPWQALALMALGVVFWHYWRLHQVLLQLGARRRTPPGVPGRAGSRSAAAR